MRNNNCFFQQIAFILLAFFLLKNTVLFIWLPAFQNEQTIANISAEKKLKIAQPIA
jgi:hypothetical protein